MRAPLVALCAALLRAAAPASAQTRPSLPAPALPSDQPVTFTAGEVEYDERADTVVTARGGVEAWQAGRTLRADQNHLETAAPVLPPPRAMWW